MAFFCSLIVVCGLVVWSSGRLSSVVCRRILSVCPTVRIRRWVNRTNKIRISGSQDLERHWQVAVTPTGTWIWVVVGKLGKRAWAAWPVAKREWAADARKRRTNDRPGRRAERKCQTRDASKEQPNPPNPQRERMGKAQCR